MHENEESYSSSPNSITWIFTKQSCPLLSSINNHNNSPQETQCQSFPKENEIIEVGKNSLSFEPVMFRNAINRQGNFLKKFRHLTISVTSKWGSTETTPKKLGKSGITYINVFR